MATIKEINIFFKLEGNITKEELKEDLLKSGYFDIKYSGKDEGYYVSQDYTY